MTDSIRQLAERCWARKGELDGVPQPDRSIVRRVENALDDIRQEGRAEVAAPVLLDALRQVVSRAEDWLTDEKTSDDDEQVRIWERHSCAEEILGALLLSLTGEDS